MSHTLAPMPQVKAEHIEHEDPGDADDDKDDPEGRAGENEARRELRAAHRQVARLLCQWPPTAFHSAEFTPQALRAKAEKAVIGLVCEAIEAYSKLLSEDQVHVCVRAGMCARP